jgi:hypothetical protein
MPHTFIERWKPIWGTEIKNWTGAATVGDYVSLKNYGSCTIIIITGAWAAGTSAITLEQATAVAGTATKELAFTDYSDDETATGVQAKKTATSNTFNLTAANKIYIIEVTSAMLDVAGGFDCITVKGASPGANADLYGVMYVMQGSRYQGSAQPSAILD